MKHWIVSLRALVPALALVAMGPNIAAAQQDYPDPGITATSIKLGGSYPFSGPASAYGVIYEGAKAYFDLVNSKGGVNGRKIEFIALDDAYQPSRVVANTRQLVEQDKVFALFNVGGTAHNMAIAEYTARNNVPQLYINTGTSIFARDRAKYPVTVIGLPAYDTEAGAFALYLKEKKPDAKIAILYQNDPFGQDLLQPFERFAAQAGLEIVGKEAYNASEPSVESQVSKLARTGADVFVSFTLPKFAAQAIQKSAELNWKPMHLLTSVSASTDLVLKPAGLEASQGIISATFLRDPSDPTTPNDPALKEYVDALAKAYPKANPSDVLRVRGYALAQLMVVALENMKTPTRDGLMQAVLNMDAEIPMFLPGLRVQTTPADALPIKSVYMERFEGEQWVVMGEPISPKLDLKAE